MKKLAFTSQEEAVFESIRKQYENCDKDKGVIYSLSYGLKILKANGKASSEGVGIDEQMEIIRKLSKAKIIDADWPTGELEENDGMTTVKLDHHNSEWLLENFGYDWITPDDSRFKDCCYIRINPAEIKKITDKYIIKHNCTLSFDENSCCFTVTDETGDIHVVSRLQTGRIFKVFKVAYTNAGKPTTKTILNKGGRTSPTYVRSDESIATDVFNSKCAVRKELSPFVKKLKATYMIVIKKAKLTQAQFDAIQ